MRRSHFYLFVILAFVFYAGTAALVVRSWVRMKKATEARLAAALQAHQFATLDVYGIHPGNKWAILTLPDSFEHGDTLWLVMDSAKTERIR